MVVSNRITEIVQKLKSSNTACVDQLQSNASKIIKTKNTVQTHSVANVKQLINKFSGKTTTSINKDNISKNIKPLYNTNNSTSNINNNTQFSDVNINTCVESINKHTIKHENIGKCQISSTNKPSGDVMRLVEQKNNSTSQISKEHTCMINITNVVDTNLSKKLRNNNTSDTNKSTDNSKRINIPNNFINNSDKSNSSSNFIDNCKSNNDDSNLAKNFNSNEFKKDNNNIAENDNASKNKNDNSDITNIIDNDKIKRPIQWLNEYIATNMPEQKATTPLCVAPKNLVELTKANQRTVVYTPVGNFYPNKNQFNGNGKCMKQKKKH